MRAWFPNDSGDLLKRALLRCLVRPPAQELGAVPETITRDMIETHFHHQFRSNRLPFAASRGTPAAWPARCFPGEARRFAHGFKSAGQLGPFVFRNGRREADVIEL